MPQRNQMLICHLNQRLLRCKHNILERRDSDLDCADWLCHERRHRWNSTYREVPCWLPLQP